MLRTKYARLPTTLHSELHAQPSCVDVWKCQAWAIPAPLPRRSSTLHRPIEAELAIKQGNKPVTPTLRRGLH